MVIVNNFTKKNKNILIRIYILKVFKYPQINHKKNTFFLLIITFRDRIKFPVLKKQNNQNNLNSNFIQVSR